MRRLLTAVLIAAVAGTAQAYDTGANLANGDRLSQSDQQSALAEMSAAGAREIRLPLEPRNWGPPGVYDDSIALIKAAALSGFKVVMIVPLQYPAAVQRRPFNPTYPGIWASYPLSQSDPNLFAAWFAPILQNLEQSGVVLGGLELGNEINWTAFNGDFPVPGEGWIFPHHYLGTDPEAKIVRTGFRQYMLSLAALKQIRDGSALNRATPVTSAGLSNPGASGPSASRLDAVTINAAPDYLRTTASTNTPICTAYTFSHPPRHRRSGTPTWRTTPCPSAVFTACRAQ